MSRQPAPKQSQYLGVGIALGVAIGTALGVALGNMAFIGVGIAIGVALGVALSHANRPGGDDDAGANPGDGDQGSD